jgi:hypothetical protein
MEWLVPILFVLVSVAQWWVRRRHVLPPSATQEAPEPNQNTDPLDEFGDLLEALGRRRHESPPTVPKTGNPTPPRILPPLEPISSSFTTSVEMANMALPQIAPHQDALPEQSKHRRAQKDPYSLKSLFRGVPTDWPMAVVLSEVLAPPVALR